MAFARTPSRIPYELIPDLVMKALNQKGKTIGMIEAERGRKYNGDASQMEYRNRSVWHNKKDLNIFVAASLKMHPSLWGPKRTSNDFPTAISRRISKLRHAGLLKDWKGNSSFGIWRLAQTSGSPVDELKMSIMERPHVQTHQSDTTGRASDAEMRQAFLSILTSGRKDGTYKFALARAILDYCHETNVTHSTSDYCSIPYEYLASRFLRYYWHQECIFKIKQTFKTNSRLWVIKTIQDVFDENAPHSFDLLKEEDVKTAEEKILRKVFGHARNNTSLVVPKFQKIRVGVSAEERKLFYDYDDNKKKIYLRPEAFEFFSANYGLLLRVVLVEWTRYLERINTIPKLVAKIEAAHVQRGSLINSRTVLLQHSNHCFYCCSMLEMDSIHVDHFIPWSYIFDDSVWNLVLACQKCNCKKSNSLAQTEFRDELIKRNVRYYDTVRKFKISLDMLNIGSGWESEIIHHYTNCRDYGFNVELLP